jgi:glycosyltransferase involved in cell wall biosynthesis
MTAPHHTTTTWGVSVVLCCHNSAQRLPRTLEHLAAQQVDPGLRWEIVVIDNASTDGTGYVARASWPATAPQILRIVREPRMGLSFARERGLREARFDVVTFVDDDNWVESGWVEVAADVMARHPEAGACGGLITAAYQAEPPVWAERFIRRYAVGTQGDDGDITDTRGWLWGAGIVVRKSAWQQLLDDGYHTMLDGRHGSKLTAGDDAEMCSALRLAGWRLRYDSRLRMQHFIPANRLTWTYLRGLYRGFGAADPGLTIYRYALEGARDGLRHRLKRMWQLQVAITLLRLARHGRKVLPRVRSSHEGDADVLEVERQIGRLGALLRQRGMFDVRLREIRAANWRAS